MYIAHEHMDNDLIQKSKKKPIQSTMVIMCYYLLID